MSASSAGVAPDLPSALAGGPLMPDRVLALQAAIGNRATRAVLSRQGRPAGRQLMRRPAPEPLVVSASTFDEAAQRFAGILTAAGETEPARLIVANGSAIHVYDETGAPLPEGSFRFTRPVQVPAGVFQQGPGLRLRPVMRHPDGSYSLGDPVAGDANFSEDVEDRSRWEAAIQGGRLYYVFATATPEQANQPAAPPPEQLPEFMQFEARGRATLPAWQSAVIALTPQIAAVNATGTFVCHVSKNVGVNTLDRMTNLMEPTDFRWEVLKLDQSLGVTRSALATRWQGALEGYDRRLRHLEEDRQTLLGDDREQQSLPEQLAREAIAEQMTETRTILAMAGQTALTVVHAVAGDTSTPNIEDYIDVPWTEPGDYFVRCLATPRPGSDPSRRRATSVAGVMVSVFDIAEIAQTALPTAEQERAGAAEGLSRLEQEALELEASGAAGQIDPAWLDVRRHLLEQRMALERSRAAAAGDTGAGKAAELAFLRAQLAYLRSPRVPRDTAEREREIEQRIRDYETRERELSTTLTAGRERLAAEDLTPTGYMSAVLVDADTGARRELTFSVGERGYVNRNLLEVVIFDVTESTGRRFSGMGDGRTGAGRPDAWENALRNLRGHLGRGRGWLAFRPPALYFDLGAGIPNPMQLQMSALDQTREMVQDATHVATLVALLAAPVTDGASLGILPVLAPVGAATGLYNVVDRAAYDDLRLDEAAVMDSINIATVGLGHVGEIRSGVRGVQIVAAGSKIAVRLLEGGQYVVMGYQAYRDILGEPVPGEDERVGRRRRLLALLNLMEQGSIPVAAHLWPAGARPGHEDLDDSPARVPDPDEPPRQTDAPRRPSPVTPPLGEPFFRRGRDGRLERADPHESARPRGEGEPAGDHVPTPAEIQPLRAPDAIVAERAVVNAHNEPHEMHRSRDGAIRRCSWLCALIVDNVRERVAVMESALPDADRYVEQGRAVIERTERLDARSRAASAQQTRRQSRIDGLASGSKARARGEQQLRDWVARRNEVLMLEATRIERSLSGLEERAGIQYRPHEGPVVLQATADLERNFADVAGRPEFRSELDAIRAAEAGEGADAVSARRWALQQRMLAAVEAEIPGQIDIARQARANVGLGTSGPDGGCLAESADGTRTESGWEDLGRAGITQATDEVLRIGTDMGYAFPAHNFDDTPGHYYAAHAEKQLNAIRPGEPIGVSIEMCFDCFNYFRLRAQTMGRPLVVADPWVTRIFHPDGRVEAASRVAAPPATGPTVQNAQPPGQ